MIKARYAFKTVSVSAERQFERANVEAKRDRYLATNPLDRYARDPEYRAKVDRIEAALAGTAGYVLDIGGNTAGEATILRQRGFQMVVGDINERALEISRERIRKFGLLCPDYVALDAHCLPFDDNSFSAVTVIEALHHFVDYHAALTEIHRVLKPGGKLFSTEPNARDPLRRLSELRDRLRGTIEKSFQPDGLRRLCEEAGFARVSVGPLAAGRSTWKLQEVPGYRRPVARLHGWLSVNFPERFGSLQLEAFKAGNLTESPERGFADLLRRPGSRSRLRYDPALKVWAEVDGDGAFPDQDGIPVLIPEERLVSAPPARRSPG